MRAGGDVCRGSVELRLGGGAMQLACGQAHFQGVSFTNCVCAHVGRLSQRVGILKNINLWFYN